MDETIHSLCSSIQEETVAIKNYTDRVTRISHYETAEQTIQTYQGLRLDHVLHLQNLCVELSRVVSEVTPVQEEGEE